MRFQTKNRKIPNVRKTKRKNQIGGDLNNFKDNLKMRLQFFNFGPKSIYTVDKCITTFENKYGEHTSKKINIQSQGLIYPDLPHFNIDNEKSFQDYQQGILDFLKTIDSGDDEFLKNNTYISYSDCHGMVSGYDIVPPDTIVCLVSGMGSLVSILPKYDDKKQFRNEDSMAYIMNNLNPEQYKSFWRNREKIRHSFRDSREINGFINCFSESSWYYPGQLIPDVILTAHANDIDSNQEFYSPYNFMFGNIDLEDQKTSLVSVGEPNEFPTHSELKSLISKKGSYTQKFSKFMHHQRRDSTKKYKLMIAVNCRGINNYDEDNTSSDFYETDVIHYHLNQDILKNYYGSEEALFLLDDYTLLSPTCTFSSIKYFYLKNNNKLFLDNAKGRNPNLSPIIPNLMAIFKRMKNNIYPEDINYLSSISINKLLFFLQKVMDPRENSISLENKNKLISSMLNEPVFLKLEKLSYGINNYEKWNCKFLDTGLEFDSIYGNIIEFISMVNYFTNSLNLNSKSLMYKSEFNMLRPYFIDHFENKHNFETYYYLNPRTQQQVKRSPEGKRKFSQVKTIIIKSPNIFLDEFSNDFPNVKTLKFENDSGKTILNKGSSDMMERIENIYIHNFNQPYYTDANQNNIGNLINDFKNLRLLKCFNLDSLNISNLSNFSRLETLHIDEVKNKIDFLNFNQSTLLNLEIYRIPVNHLRLQLPQVKNIILNDVPILHKIHVSCLKLERLAINFTTDSEKVEISSDYPLNLVIQDCVAPESLDLDVNQAKIRNLIFENCKLGKNLLYQLIQAIDKYNFITGYIKFNNKNTILQSENPKFDSLYHSFLEKKKIIINGLLEIE